MSPTAPPTRLPSAKGPAAKTTSFPASAACPPAAATSSSATAASATSARISRPTPTAPSRPCAAAKSRPIRAKTMCQIQQLLNLSAIADRNLGRWFPGAGADGFNRLDDVEAFHNLPADNVLAVEIRRGGGADEELGAVRVSPGIRHRQGAWSEALAGLALKGFVIELAAVNGLAARAVPAREISPLAHEIRDQAME